MARLSPDIARDARDATMLLLGYAAALRGAELVGLDRLRPGSTLQGGTGVLSIEDQGLLVTLMTGKGSQVTPVYLAIPDREMPSLRAWLKRWVAHAQIGSGEPLFRAIDNRAVIWRRRLALMASPA